MMKPTYSPVYAELCDHHLELAVGAGDISLAQ